MNSANNAACVGHSLSLAPHIRAVRYLRMNHKLIIKPLIGVGPLELGMYRSMVQKVFPVAPKAFKKTKWSEHETDAFDDIGFHVYYGGANPVVDFIEMFPEDATTFLLDGLDIFRTVSSDLIAHLSDKAEVLEKTVGCCYIYPTLELSLWRSHLPASSEIDRFSAIGIGSKG